MSNERIEEWPPYRVGLLTFGLTSMAWASCYMSASNRETASLVDGEACMSMQGGAALKGKLLLNQRTGLSELLVACEALGLEDINLACARDSIQQTYVGGPDSPRFRQEVDRIMGNCSP